MLTHRPGMTSRPLDFPRFKLYFSLGAPMAPFPFFTLRVP
ncbi:hypothetical protein J2R76_005526 [Bradyrhizobium sp. USDA 4532]|nr:hypothetical protein [Bradyrhizobium sp. USDA 4545]MCP1847348.1 hypothetical protein [Bradyrhizobium sp. USDA 4541]MCP1921935.1 hypothetical protein [Bradyrhizobium sp. USDA 4532]